MARPTDHQENDRPMNPTALPAGTLVVKYDTFHRRWITQPAVALVVTETDDRPRRSTWAIDHTGRWHQLTITRPRRNHDEDGPYLDEGTVTALVHPGAHPDDTLAGVAS